MFGETSVRTVVSPVYDTLRYPFGDIEMGFVPVSKIEKPETSSPR